MWPHDYDPLLCGCRQHCGDLPEDADDEYATCKGLPRAPSRRWWISWSSRVLSREPT